jgi:segregation and condensation protein B
MTETTNETTDTQELPEESSTDSTGTAEVPANAPVDPADGANTPGDTPRETAADVPAEATAAPQSGAADSVTPESIVEALLFSTDRPLSTARIAQILGIGGAADVKQHIDALNERYERTGASFRIEQVAKGYQMLTLPPYNPWVGQLHKVRAESRLSGAALETLAIIAYKQPALRADIETIRGVAVGDMLVRLRDMNLVRIVGRAEEIGRPLLYGTTRKFLEVFGLNSLKDLPKLDPDRPDAVPALRVVDDGE